MPTCTYCGKPIGKRSWIGFTGNTQQCHRLWCRIKTGHVLWEIGLEVTQWKAIIDTRFIRISIPIFRKFR